MQEKKRSAFWFSLALSVGTFVILTSSTAVQFLYKYTDDLFHKHVEFWVVARMFILTLLSVGEFLIPISILAFGVVYYRERFRTARTTLTCRSGTH